MLTIGDGTWTWTDRDTSVFYHDLCSEQVTILGTEPDASVAFCGSTGESNPLARFVASEISGSDSGEIRGTVHVGQYRNGLIGAFDEVVYTELLLILEAWRARGKVGTD